MKLRPRYNHHQPNPPFQPTREDVWLRLSVPNPTPITLPKIGG